MYVYMQIFRTCLHKGFALIFDPNFANDKAKIRKEYGMDFKDF